MVARVAEVEVCDDISCQTGHLLVRGDRISFVSTEQVKLVGYHARNPVDMPSDIELPSSYVLVHDTTGQLFNRCDMYFVRWHDKSQRGADLSTRMGRKALADVKAYFGENSVIRAGSVDVPEGPWKRDAIVKCIRYRRHGNETLFEHAYDPPVHLFYSARPPAWRLALPQGCLVDERGFVKP